MFSDQYDDKGAKLSIQTNSTSSCNNIEPHDSGQVVEEARSSVLQRRIDRNRWVTNLTIFSLSLDIPFQRYLFSQRLNVALAWVRFIGVVWLLVKLVVILNWIECEHARFRAYLYDWTIYYPLLRRVGLVRTYVGMLMFHTCFKITILYRKRMTFDASLIDYLCREPPIHLCLPYKVALAAHERAIRVAGGRRRGGLGHIGMQQLNLEQSISFPSLIRLPDGHLDKHELEASSFVFETQHDVRLVETRTNLRDRAHWFALSDMVWHKFKRNLFWILLICLPILAVANFRLGTIPSERACDIEMPFLRALGLFELNFALIECMITLIGVHGFFSIIKDDLLLQAERVEEFMGGLLEDARQSGRLDKAFEEALAREKEDLRLGTANLLDDYVPSKDEREQKVKRRGASGLAGGLGKELGLDSGSLDRLTIRHATRSAIPNRAAVPEPRSPPPPPKRPPLFAKNSARAIFQWPASLLDRMRPTSLSSGEFAVIQQGRRQLYSPSLEPRAADDVASALSLLSTSGASECADEEGQARAACRRITGAIMEAQNKIIQLLSCIDNSKPPISFIGTAIILWMLTSLSFAPLLVYNLQSKQRANGHLIYAATGLISLSSGLMFTLTGAEVHKRAVDLATNLFRVCFLFHSRSVAMRWNKILMSWYCPNRIAFKVSGTFELTYLSVIKAISFLVSGLTLVLNYV